MYILYYVCLYRLVNLYRKGDVYIYDKKIIKSRVASEEYDALKSEAKEKKISMSHLVRVKVTDTQDGVQALSDKIMKLMPRFYYLVEQIEAETVRKELMEIGGQICQRLK